MAVVYATQANNLAILTWLGATRLLAATMDLFQNNITVNASTPVGSLTVATFTGYAAAVLTWNLPSIGGGGIPELVSDEANFRPTDAVTPNAIYGWWIASAGMGTPLEYLANFDGAPLPMDSALRQINVTVRVRITNNAVSAVVVVS